jgi:hypothetical protein
MIFFIFFKWKRTSTFSPNFFLQSGFRQMPESRSLPGRKRLDGSSLLERDRKSVVGSTVRRISTHRLQIAEIELVDFAQLGRLPKYRSGSKSLNFRLSWFYYKPIFYEKCKCYTVIRFSNHQYFEDDFIY